VNKSKQRAGWPSLGTRAYTASLDERRRKGRRSAHGRAAPRTVLRPRADDARGDTVREQIQDALDAGEEQEWHLVGVSDVLPERGVILFWDTSRPSFGRTSR
jgi:hypothetical protein